MWTSAIKIRNHAKSLPTQLPICLIKNRISLTALWTEVAALQKPRDYLKQKNDN